jgi:formamidopyrimidine-DNA glycosylase
MPELPEVENIRRGLEPVLVGQRILRVEQRRPDLRFPFPRGFAKSLAGRRVTVLSRRAKYLLAHLDNSKVLLMHLGMSGRFRVSSPSPRKRKGGDVVLGEFVYDPGDDPKHDHVVFTLASGTVVTYHDPRRFGAMDLIAQADLDTHWLLAGLGVEPLGNEFNATYLAQRAHGRATTLKAFLSNQRIIAGLGNIYVCEALWRAKLAPTRGAATLANKRNAAPTDRALRLAPSIRAVLEDAILAGGSTLRDYRRANGEAGTFQSSFAVYGREGEPCLTPGCKGIVRRTVQGGRSTFYCASCQR